MIEIFLKALLSSAKESPAVVFFLVSVALLAFILYGALFISNRGAEELILYIILAVCILVVLLLLFIFNKQKI